MRFSVGGMSMVGTLVSLYISIYLCVSVCMFHSMCCEYTIQNKKKSRCEAEIKWLTWAISLRTIGNIVLHASCVPCCELRLSLSIVKYAWNIMCVCVRMREIREMPIWFNIASNHNSGILDVCAVFASAISEIFHPHSHARIYMFTSVPFTRWWLIFFLYFHVNFGALQVVHCFSLSFALEWVARLL